VRQPLSLCYVSGRCIGRANSDDSNNSVLFFTINMPPPLLTPYTQGTYRGFSIMKECAPECGRCHFVFSVAVHTQMTGRRGKIGRGPVAKFIVPDWGNKVDSGIGLSYQPANARRLGYVGWRRRPVRRPYTGVNYIPQSGTMNLATAFFAVVLFGSQPSSPPQLPLHRIFLSGFLLSV
jgi:hypothetical protein